MTNATRRIFTGLIAAPFFVGVMYMGGWPFGLLVAAIGLLAQYELYKMMEQAGLQPFRVAGLALGAVVLLRGLLPFALPLAVAFLVLLIIVDLFRHNDRPIANLGGTLFGVIYPAALLGFLVDLRLARGVWVDNLEAFYLTLAVMLLIWSTDVFAYYSGRAFGKTPLMPSVSPKKTWEGSIGGAISTLVVALFLKIVLLDMLTWPDAVALALICGVISQFGDLAESRLKRSVAMKDSGDLLPGHGGMLDRFDAAILSIPLAYLYLAYIAQVL